MKATIPVLIALVCLLSAAIALAEEPALETDDDKILYMLGMAISRNLVAFELTDAELAKVQAGLADGVLGRDPRVPMETYAPRIDPALQERMKRIVERNKGAGSAYLATASEEPGAELASSGLVYRELEAGDGPSPGPEDTVRIHYRGTLVNGRVFDSSMDEEDRTPAVFSLNGVIPCFGEGVQKMKVGGKSKLTCPPELAYGDQGARVGIPPGATIQFEVHLLEIVAPETAAPEIAAPETAAPETAAPETAAPETAAPQTETP